MQIFTIANVFGDKDRISYQVKEESLVDALASEVVGSLISRPGEMQFFKATICFKPNVL